MAPRAVPVLVLVAALAATAGCRSLRRGPPPGRAVVVFEEGREADAETARRLLEEAGWRVAVETAGPARRTRSSLALYGLSRRGAPAAGAADVLEPLGDVETLPFSQPGPGDTSAVLWLAR